MAKTRIARLKQNKQFAELFDAGLTSSPTHSGVMVALYPPAPVAQQLAALDGADTKAADMHLTLCYCGDSSALSDTQIAGAILAAEQMSRCYNPLSGVIGGLGRFNATGSSDGKDVIVALVDVPGLEDFQDDICDELAECGCTVSEAHGFTPHITLAYVEAGSDFSLPSFASIPVTFATLSVVVADKRLDFPMRAELTMQQAEGMEEAEPYAEPSAYGNGWRLFNEKKFIEPPEYIPLLPKPGTFKHPAYGDVVISHERNARFVDNINKAVYQNRLPIDAEHDLKTSGAVGWITGARQNSDGSADGKVEWNERGNTMLRDNRFGFVSPEFYDSWVQPDTGEEYKDILIGAGLVTRPFFKPGSLRPLIASERGLYAPTQDTTENQTVVFYEPFVQEVYPMAEDTIKSVDSKAFTELQHQFSELKDKLAKAEAEANEAKATAQKFQEVLDLSNKRVAELERAAQLKRFSEIVAGKNGKRWIGDAAKHVATLTKFADVFGENSADFKEYVEQQNANTEQLYASQAFSEVGTDMQASTQTAWQKIQAIAARKMSEEKITMPVAIDRAATENPDLYKLYLEGK